VISLLLYVVLHVQSVLYPAGNASVPTPAKATRSEAPNPSPSANLATVIDPNG
jgi:hypothetical protein